MVQISCLSSACRTDLISIKSGHSLVVIELGIILKRLSESGYMCIGKLFLIIYFRPCCSVKALSKTPTKAYILPPITDLSTRLYL